MNVRESKYKNLKECKLNFKVATQENKCSNLKEKVKRNTKKFKNAWTVKAGK